MSSYDDEKKFSSDDEKKSFELLPIKNIYSFKWNKLVFKDKAPYIFQQIFDLWENNFNIEKNVHITEHLQIHYKHEQKCLPFLLRIENINGVIQRGKDLKRICYFNPTSLIQSGLIYEIFANFEEKIYDVLKIPHNKLLNSGGLIPLACTQKIP